MSDQNDSLVRVRAWRSVGNSFAFATANYVQTLRNVGGLMIVLIGLVTWNLYTTSPVTAADVEMNTTAAWDYMSHFYLFAFLCAIPVLSILVAVYRTYYEGAANVGFYFRFGGGEMRIVGATLLMGAIGAVFAIAITIVTIVILVIAIFYGAQTGIDMENLAEAFRTGSAEGVRPSFVFLLFGIYALAILAFCWIIMWVSARFITLYPDVVRSKQIRVGVNWTATKGHAWRIFLTILAYLIVSTGPFMLLLAVLSISLPGAYGDYYSLVLGQPAEDPTTPNLPAAVVVAVTSQLAYLFYWIWSGGLYCQIRDTLLPEVEPGAVEIEAPVA